MTSYQVIHGDSKEVLKDLIIKGIQVDSIVTDPPYELGFMGKKWDSTGIAYDKELWQLALMVLKPGGHLLAFGGSRTYHRMACAIEDAGFEIRDSIRYLQEIHYPAYVYGQGFPKSLNVKKAATKQSLCCACEENTLQYNHEKVSLHKDLSNLSDRIQMSEQIPSNSEQKLQQEVCEQIDRYCKFNKDSNGIAQRNDSSGMCAMSKDNLETESMGKESASTNLLKEMQWEDKIFSSNKVQQQHERSSKERQTNGCFKSSMERRCNLLQNKRELHGSSLCEVSNGVSSNGKERWICDGTSNNNGDENRSDTYTNGSRESYRPESSKQQDREFGTLPNECRSQKRGSWEICTRCSKPILPEGLGSALKPAWEPIVVARKPLEKGLNIAENVIKHGTGGINIDGCRVVYQGQSDIDRARGRKGEYDKMNVNSDKEFNIQFSEPYFKAEINNQGRFPANLIHDGSEEVEAEFAKYGILKSGGKKDSSYINENDGCFTPGGNQTSSFYGSSGLASRFFYCAKASKSDRQGSKHPTVKPIALMRYLCRLVTPPNGTVLDHFAGTGTTGQAALEEGFNCILIEKEAEYIADINKRLDNVALPLWKLDNGVENVNKEEKVL